MSYKSFKIERVIYGPGEEPEYRVYGKEAGWFRSWDLISRYSSEEKAEDAIKRFAHYPQVTSRRFYDEYGKRPSDLDHLII